MRDLFSPFAQRTSLTVYNSVMVRIYLFAAGIAGQDNEMQKSPEPHVELL